MAYLNVESNNLLSLKNESRKLYPSVINNIGTLPYISSGNTTNLGWKSATKPTITANSWVQMTNVFEPPCGRTYVIEGFDIETTDDCTICIQHEILPVSIDSNTATSNQNNFQQYLFSQLSTTGGIISHKFKNPLLIKYGERLIFYYNRNSTTGTNWQISLNGGYDKTNDEDLYARIKLGFIGDSIFITSETRGLQYANRDGTIIGQTPFILKSKLADIGKQVRIINLCIGGTMSGSWDDAISRGKIDSLKLDLIICNLGMNDASITNNLSVSTGVDGFFKKSLKNIIRKYFLINPNGKFFLCSIPPTDETSRIATISVSSGTAGFPYNGQQKVIAYRLEIQQVYNELVSTYPKLFFVDISNAYTTSESAFVETVTNTRIHANNTLGHPRIAQILYNLISINL